MKLIKSISALALTAGILFTGVTAQASECDGYVKIRYGKSVTTTEACKVESYIASFEEDKAFEIVRYHYSDAETHYFTSVRRPWVKYNISTDDLIWKGLDTKTKYTMVFTDYSKHVLLAMQELN